MKYLAVVLSLASSLLAGPFTLAPSSATLFSDREIYDPGLIPNLPALYTFGNPHPDFGRCGQIGFVSTLEDGSPDPKAIPGFIQINTPCRPEPAFGLDLDEHHDQWREPGEHPTAVPEPATWGFVLFAVAVMALAVGGVGDKIRHKLQRFRTHEKEILAVDQVIADEPDTGGRATVIQVIVAERAQWKAKYEQQLNIGLQTYAQVRTHDGLVKLVRENEWRPMEQLNLEEPQCRPILTIREGSSARVSVFDIRSGLWANWSETFQPTHFMLIPPLEPRLILRTPPVPVMRDGEVSK